MPDQEEIAGYQQRLLVYRARLSICLKQLAMHGQAHAPPVLLLDIRATCEEIRQIKIRLRDSGVLVDDLPSDEQRESEQLPPHVIPRHAPPAPRQYVERHGLEESLRNALLAEHDQPLTILHGLSGTGKTSLAAQVVQQLKDDDFPDGVLWGNLDDLTPNDLLLQFLGALDSTWYHSIAPENTPLRQVFWRLLGGSNARALIVLDNVKETRQIIELLPPTLDRIGRCRVLVMSIHMLNDLPIPWVNQPLGCFTNKEALELFRMYIGDDKFSRYKEKLVEISRRFEYLPQLLTAAAREFATGRVSPNTYAIMLEQGEGQHKLIGNTIWESFELILGNLAPEQVVLFELVSVLGESDWQDAMLASVALRPLSDVRRDLSTLVEYELVKRVSHERYRVSTLIRDFARQRFWQRPDYALLAAYILLARYCLDLAQDLDAALLARPDLRATSGQPVARTDEIFVQGFREGLMPEISHIREALEWTTTHKEWDILRRFSYVASMEMLQGLVANGYAIRMTLRMATLVEPIIWLQGDHQALACRSMIASASWSYRAPLDPIQTVEQSVVASPVNASVPERPNADARCELSLEIMAGQIIDGVFDTMILADARWVGVRASGLLCRAVDIVGGQFAACDLSHSVFVRCDARRATLLGSNMSHTLLREVKLQGANLQGLNLAGTVLEHVDLRGADLREANLAGTVLEHVDLRGADLRGANLTGAFLKEVNASGADLRDADCSLVRADMFTLDGCRIERVRWAGAITHGFIFKDKSFLIEIEGAAKEPPDQRGPSAQGRRRPIHAIAQRKEVDFSDTDLRGVDLLGLRLPPLDLRGADLRLATLERAQLGNSELRDANLRGANLQAVDLTQAGMRGADLYAATLNQALLQKADLSGANLRRAYMESADLRAANLQVANLRAACLDRATMHSTNLRQAELVGASIKQASLIRADLTDADLTDADLSGADLTGADLTGAICINTNFSGAVIEDRQLAQAKRLDRATTPGQQVVQAFDANYGQADIPEQVVHLQAKEVGQLSSAAQQRLFAPASFLRFATCTGEFSHMSLARRDMIGAQLAGRFTRVDFTATNLAHATLSGIFSRVNLTGANLAGARLGGMFSDVTLHDANFQDTNVRGASLINAKMQGARNLSDEQLQQAFRLRGSTLPDGSRYDNRFKLAGDREDALNMGYNPDDPEEMRSFCVHTKPTYKSTA